MVLFGRIGGQACCKIAGESYRFDARTVFRRANLSFDDTPPALDHVGGFVRDAQAFS